MGLTLPELYYYCTYLLIQAPFPQYFEPKVRRGLILEYSISLDYKPAQRVIMQSAIYTQYLHFQSSCYIRTDVHVEQLQTQYKLHKNNFAAAIHKNSNYYWSCTSVEGKGLVVLYVLVLRGKQHLDTVFIRVKA